MDISFNCPHCNQHLAVDQTGAGMTVNCPNCNEPIVIPLGASSPPPVRIVAATIPKPQLAKRIALALGIAFVFPILIHYGVHYGVMSFVSPPEYTVKYPESDVRDTMETFFKKDAEFQKKNDEYDKAVARYERHLPRILFAVTVGVGLIALLFGAFLWAPAIGTGLMLGGIFTICDACYIYSSGLPEIAILASLLVAFGLLIFLGYRRFERKAI